MIYTVFFIEEGTNEMPQDFNTYEKALEYAERKGIEYIIECTTGKIV